MSASLIAFLSDQSQWNILFDVQLKNKTSFQCKSQTKAMFAPNSMEELSQFVKALSQNGFEYLVDFHVLGKGSNLLFRDAGYGGCLIDLAHLNTIEVVEKSDELTLNVGAGVGMGALLQRLRKEGYTGFEFVFGIPGSIGGGIRMNAGTPDGWFSNCLKSVQGITKDGEVFSKVVGEEDFVYRDFPFGRDKIITGGVFVFQKAPAQVIQEKIQKAKEKRARQPLQYPNFGSVFKNPKPQFAGALIEEVGLKGFQIGDAQISDQHANFIINHGEAKTQEVLQLIEKAKKTVFDQAGVSLETEVHILGEDK